MKRNSTPTFAKHSAQHKDMAQRTTKPQCLLSLRRNRAGRKHRGATLVEFAMVIPIVLAMLLGIAETGLLMRNYAILSNASREGARAASTGSPQDIIYARVLQASQPLLKSNPNGTLANGGIWMEYDPMPLVGGSFNEFPDYVPVGEDNCPTVALPTKRPSLVNQIDTATPQAQFLLDTAKAPTFSQVHHRIGHGGYQPPPSPTAQPGPTPTPMPTPTPGPTPTPSAGPTPTPQPVPTPGPTPTPDPTQTGVACKNTVPYGSIIRITVRMRHQSLTGFFPGLSGREITVRTMMQREYPRG